MKKSIRTKSAQLMSLAIASALVIPTAIPRQALAAGNEGTQKDSTRRDSAAVSESERLAIQLIIAAAVAEQRGADLAQVDKAVVNKYNTIAKTFGYTVPVSGLGTSIVTYLGPQTLKTSAEFAGPLLTLLKPAFQALVDGLKFSGGRLEALLQVIKFDILIEKSSDTVKSSYQNLVEPVLKLLITKNTAVLSGSSSAGALLYTSVKFTTNSAQEAMSWETLRNMLGQDDIIRTRIDGVVSGMSSLLDLDAGAQAKLKISIYDEILSQAIQNNFSEDASKYNLDIIALMQKNGSISADRVKALYTVRNVASALKLERSTTRASRDIVAANIGTALNIAAVLESNINSGKISDQRTVAEMQRLLGAMSAQMALIGLNIK